MAAGSSRKLVCLVHAKPDQLAGNFLGALPCRLEVLWLREPSMVRHGTMIYDLLLRGEPFRSAVRVDDVSPGRPPACKAPRHVRGETFGVAQVQLGKGKPTA